MTDREKVVKAFEFCLMPPNREETENDICCHEGCPYYREYNGGKCISAAASDAIALLKAQEPVIVKCTTKRTLVDDTYEVVYRDENFYDCPACGQRLSRWNKDTQIKYCWTCGQAVKWE